MADCEKMTFSARNQKDFVGYEYKEIAAQDSMVSMLLDGYKNFGWELNENLPESGLRGRAGSAARTVLRLRRDPGYSDCGGDRRKSGRKPTGQDPPRFSVIYSQNTLLNSMKHPSSTFKCSIQENIP